MRPIVALTWCKELLGFVASHDATYLGVRCVDTSRAQRVLKSINPGAIKLLKYLPHLLDARLRRGADGLLASQSARDLRRVGSIEWRLFTC